MGTPRIWFKPEDPRIVNFTPTAIITEALSKMRGVMPEVFKFDGIVSVSTEHAKKIVDKEDKEKDLRVTVTQGPRPSVHVQHPLSNVLSVDTPTKPLDEIIKDAVDMTGSPKLFPELVIHDLGWKYKIPHAAEEYIQGVDSLFQYTRSRGYHTKPMDKLLGLRFFKPFDIMEAYINSNPEIGIAIHDVMRSLEVEAKVIDLRRWRSILETKWIVGDTKGFLEFEKELLPLQKELTKGKFEQDVAEYHYIANQQLQDHGISVGGHLYELNRVAETNLYSPYIPLWHEDIPKGMVIK